LLNVIPRVRKRVIGPVKGIRLILEMMDRQPIIDIVRGAAMAKGVTFKTDAPDS
jgi:hypothetical protein